MYADGGILFEHIKRIMKDCVKREKMMNVEHHYRLGYRCNQSQYRNFRYTLTVLGQFVADNSSHEHEET
jgi:predicted glycosyltransferase involved in capsule biosynthesis